MRFLGLLSLVLLVLLPLLVRASHARQHEPVRHPLALDPGASLELQLRTGPARLVVPAGEAFSIGSLRLELPGGVLLEIERDGTPVELWEADLDANGRSELLLACRSAGSGSHLALTLLRRRSGRGWEAQRLPPFVGVSGHLGHERLEVRSGAAGDLVELEYPIYLPDDANARPTGGHARVTLDLATESWH